MHLTPEQRHFYIHELAKELPPWAYNAKAEFIPGKTPVFYSGPYFDHREVEAALKAFLTGKWLVTGEEVAKFQWKFARKFGVRFAHMVNSGSSANLVLVAAAKKFFDWEDGDEIIVSPVGFPTTIAPIVQNGLKAVFADIELGTLNFDLDEVERKITNRTKAIFVSPVLGNPPDMDRLREICNAAGIIMLGDNCDSLGTKWNGQWLTDYYAAWSTSFYPAHHITTGEGGMVCSNNEQLVNYARQFSWWGRDCHIAGTKIYTKDGIKNIEDVVKGDEVYTHESNYKKVYDLIRKPYTGKLYTIKSRRKQPLTMTANHPILVKRPNNNIEWVLAKDISDTDCLLQAIPKKISETPDYLTVAYSTLVGVKETRIPAEKELFRLLGYWVAEGSLRKGLKGSNGVKQPSAKNKYYAYSVDFAFHKNEIEYIDDVVALMERYFGASVFKRYTSTNCISLSFKSRLGYEFFKTYGGVYSYRKRLKHEFIHYHEDFIREFIIGFWRGDGSGDFQQFSITTSSETLISQIRMMLLRFGISGNTFIRTIDKHASSVVNGRTIIAKHDLYTIQLYGDNYRKMGELLDEQYTPKKSHKTDEKFFENYSVHQITEIEQKDVVGVMVYNFEVEDDHSYHANDIISHNCVCIGAANLKPCGSCGKRFDNWLAPDYNGVVDHKYVFTQMGYNLKPLDFQGAIGSVQLDKFDEIHLHRRQSYDTIATLIETYVPQVEIVSELDPAETSWFGVPIVCDTKETKVKLQAHFENNKIQTRNYFAGNILLHPGYKHLDDFKKYPNANQALDRVFFVGAAPHYDTEIFNYFEEVLSKWI